MTVNPADNSLTLPAGVTIAATRETSQQGANGMVEQGLKYTLRLPNGTNTSVFIPYSVLPNTAAVAASLNERIEQVQAINNLQSGI